MRTLLIFLTIFIFPLKPASANQKIVSCQVIGGLGNQLFQVANTLATAWTHGYMPLFPKTSYAQSRVSPRPVYWDSFFHKLALYPEELQLDFTSCYEESIFYYRPLILSGDQIRLEGFFVSAKYFDHYRDKILEYIQLPAAMQATVNERYKAIIDEHTTETVSIHIRLDDTFHEPVPGVIDFWRKPYDSYYDSAIEQFPGDVTFVVFSDNSDWSREYMKEKLQGRHVSYVSDKDYLDLALMALCKHNIIVNSTYSWWGAYLNQNPNKIVVSPKFWQAKENTPYRPDVLMPNWVLIENIH
jgi:hypothetical protein